ncbi:MAG: hypothetical protein ABI321_03070 [Polyangia bacterium]
MRTLVVVLLVASGCGGLVTGSVGTVDGSSAHHDGSATHTDGGMNNEDASIDVGDGGTSGDMTHTGPSCVPAAKEDCTNDVDDDCNGIVNDGCADTLGIGATTMVAPYVGADGNANATNLSVRCPTNAFVTQLSIVFNDSQTQAAGLRLGCSTATLNRGTSGYSVTLVPVSPNPYVALIAAAPAAGTDPPIVATCPGAGLRAMFATKGSYDTGGILGLFTRCGVGALTLNADNTLGIAMTPATTAATPVGSVGSDGYAGYDYGVGAGLTHTNVAWTCDAGSVVVGFNGRVSTSGQISAGVPGAALDKVQPICGTLVPHYIQ